VSGPDGPARSRQDRSRRDATLPPPPDPLPVAVADSHCHLDLRDGDEWLDVETALEQATAVGVDRVVQIGCDVESSRWSVAAAQSHRQVVAAVALHPNEAPVLAAQGPGVLETALSAIADLARDDRVRAIGETGLDRFRTGEEGFAAQEASFRAHIALAKQVGKPLVVHDRDAHDDVLRVLDDAGAPDIVVMHCFSGDAAFARRCVERGYILSFAGTVTFKNAEPLRDALRATPLDHVLVETDAPFLTPTPHRGRTNASYLVPLTVRSMAATLVLPVADVAEAISATSDRVFGPW
jgi:TatD DNase family protein